ncbi:hypothetical protein Hypma_006804 [Hypsizygus marmoreus]|uniref:AB hydrolase-1 domain-containing protein n=1 Tax=Hypsizygus marmoreus TaxID=39966 RepID=A0A369K1K9_HYPMA|nr:hypothetical protein Hypma_006804 [Hypsizygus marmoreus]
MSWDTTELIKLPSGVSIEVALTAPSASDAGRETKLAVCLHPWSWLGGQMDDPVLLSLVGHLEIAGYYVLRYNSRGVGKSTGWASFTGFSECKDLEELVTWAVDTLTNVRSLVIIGYSYGALIASLHAIIPDVATAHILISYPLGPIGWLTLFHTSTYTARLKELIQNANSRVLIIYGDQDEFTAASRYKAWRDTLEQGSHGGCLKVVEVAGASHFWRGRRVVSKQMPLPDERPRQSVANLIGRFENQTKRQSTSTTSGSPRSLSVISHNTGDSAKEEAKERREWPPKSVSVEKLPPIIPSSSWTRSQSSGSQPSSPPNSEPAATQAPSFEDPALTPRPKSTTSIPDAAKFTSLPQRQMSVGVSAPNLPSQSTLIPTPTTAKPPIKGPVLKAPTSAGPKTPLKTAGRPSTTANAQPLKPQHTGPASTSASSVRKSVPKPTPVTPARAKTPSRAATSASTVPKTPSSTRPKTPSGLFAPTAASLARARNAQPQPPTPTKKPTLSSSAAERLSKPTAASLSRARTPTATSSPARGAKPTARGGAMRGGRPGDTSVSTRAKKDSPPVPKVAKAAVVTATGAGAVIVATLEEERTSDAEMAQPVENGHDIDSPEVTADESPKHEDTEQSVEHSAQPSEPELVAPSDSGEVTGVTAQPPEPGYVAHDDEEESKDHDSSLDTEFQESGTERSFASDSETNVAEDVLADEVKSRSHPGDEIEDMVNLLESVSISKARSHSISSIPDEVAEIPDEE